MLNITKNIKNAKNKNKIELVVLLYLLGVFILSRIICLADKKYQIVKSFFVFDKEKLFFYISFNQELNIYRICKNKFIEYKPLSRGKGLLQCLYGYGK